MIALIMVQTGLLLFASLICLGSGRTFYTDKDKAVSGHRDGSWEAPFGSISDCVASLGTAGDECQIRAGTYHEEVHISGLKGTADAPIVVRGYGEERPLLDGTVDVLPDSGVWEQTDGVYHGQINFTIWQFFLGDLMMTNARWPNGKWSDKTIFDGRNAWSKIAKTSKVGLIVNKDDSLKDTGLNMTGAVAVLNIGSWNTFVSKVDSHAAGTNKFTYTDTFGNKKIKSKVSRYFLEDKRNLLDAPEEWFFDNTTKTVYFIPPSDVEFDPTTKLRGKVQTYAMTISDSEHLRIKNLDFFGTTVKGISEVKINKQFIDHIRFDSLNFKFPTCSRRMLGNISLTEGTDIDGKSWYPRETWWKTFTFFNNTFHGADGIALKYSGVNVTLENNLFEYNDWTSANMLRWGGGAATIASDSLHDVFLRNTLRYNGEAHGIRPGFLPNVTLNRVIGQCWGLQQNDGAGIHLTILQQSFSHIHRNWIHDSPKYGIRFDGTPPRVGYNGFITENVAYRCTSGGIQMKGDNHTALGNLAFDIEEGAERPFPGCSLCVWKHVRANKVEINAHSVVRNNMADAANGCKKFDGAGKLIYPIEVWPLNGKIVENNVIHPALKNHLHDADNDDFRVLKTAGTTDVGPYPSPDEITHYWIPGRQLYKASSPVPPDGAQTVNHAHRDALMWLNAYGCSTHEVYFGQDPDKVNSAGRTSEEYVGTARGGGNVMYLREEVREGEVYYWRVDAVTDNGLFYRGDVWEFRT